MRARWIGRVTKKRQTRLVLSGAFLLLLFLTFMSLFRRNVEKSVPEHVVIVAVVCGQTSEFLERATVMIKSAILFKGETQLTFVIFADFDLQADLRARLQLLQSGRVSNATSFSYDLRNISFPDDGHDGWRKELEKKPEYRRCTLLRLYLPDLLKDYANVLYVDVDVIFLNELSNMWHHLQLMNSSQVAAVSQDHEVEALSAYRQRQTKIIPFYGSCGLNAGVILMKLEKMREIKWVDEVNTILKEFLKLIDGCDQDIINIYFHHHPDRLYLYSCRYNYAWFMCIENVDCKRESFCKDAHLSGVSILHGHSKAFNWVPMFSAIYESFRNYKLNTNISRNLIEPLRRHFIDKACLSLENEFMQNLVRLFDKT